MLEDLFETTSQITVTIKVACGKEVMELHMETIESMIKNYLFSQAYDRCEFEVEVNKNE